MIYIDGIWRQVETMDDAINIVREKIGYEFAEKVEDIYDGIELEMSELKEELEAAQETIEDLEASLEEVKNEKNLLQVAAECLRL